MSIDSFIDSIFHKTYSCSDSGKISNALIDIF